MGNRTPRKYAKGSLVALLAVGLALAGSPGLLQAAPGDIVRVDRPADGYRRCLVDSAQSMSEDGRYTVFICQNIGDAPQNPDAFVADRATGEVSLVNSKLKGITEAPSISRNGRYVAFRTNAPFLDPRDFDGTHDWYVLDQTTGTMQLVSVNEAGEKANSGEDPVSRASISPDGSLVAFSSGATNLVPNDTNGGYADIYVKNLNTGEVTLASVDSDGNQLAGNSFNPSMTPDGRFVVYLLHISVPRTHHIVVRDLHAGTTEIITDGQNAYSYADSGGAISDDGRYVVFRSGSSNLVPNDTNNTDDIFVYDRQTASMQIASQNELGQLGNDASSGSVISGSGRYVVFGSYSSNLVPGDTNTTQDIFRKDLATGEVELVDTNSAGEQGDHTYGASGRTSVSRDGRYVAFSSEATNLVPNDTNGFIDTFIKELDVTDVINPTISYELSPAPNASGWHSGDVTVTFTCEDAESGIASCTEPVTVSTEGEGQTVTGTAVDNAGNSMSVDAVLNIDKTVPTTATPTMSGIVLGILLGSTTNISATVGDNLSGVVRAEYYFDTDPGQGNGTAMNLSASPTTNGTATATADASALGGGQHTLYVRSQDDAGNWSVVASRTFFRLF